MEAIDQQELKKRFNDAVDSFVAKVKDDQNVIAVIVGGSLSYDVVWEKSDIDMTLIVRDQVLKNNSYCIIEDGITINVHVVTRSDFKRSMEKTIGGSFFQAYMAQGKMIYCTDDSLYEFFEDMKNLGSNDIALSALFMACELVSTWEKAQKWLVARKDPLYAQYYILKAAESLANLELCLKGQPTSRNAIQRVIEINPELMAPFYQDAMARALSPREIQQALDKIDTYLESHLDIIKKPVLDFMSDGEIKTVTLITKHFRTEAHFIILIFDYLAEKGVIEKVSQTIRITPKSRPVVEELGYLYIPY